MFTEESLTKDMSGMEAVVVTDIKGSTKLWSGYERSMPELLRLHDVVLRRNLIKFGGREILTEGDSFQLAFKDVNSAVAWCVEVQRELLNEPWPEDLLAGAPECMRIEVDEDEVEASLRTTEFWRQLIVRRQGGTAEVSPGRLPPHSGDQPGSSGFQDAERDKERSSAPDVLVRPPVVRGPSRFHRESTTADDPRDVLQPVTPSGKSLTLQGLLRKARKSTQEPSTISAAMGRVASLVSNNSDESDHNPSSLPVSPTVGGPAAFNKSFVGQPPSRAALAHALTVDSSQSSSSASKGLFRLFQRNRSMDPGPLGALMAARKQTLFCGPRVRMGVHCMPKGSDEDPGKLLSYIEVAKAVADGADGGQIVLSGVSWKMVDASILARLVGEPVIPLHLGRHVTGSGGAKGKKPTISRTPSGPMSPGPLSSDADSPDPLRSFSQDIIGVLPRSLLARYHYFSPLKTSKQLTPSLFDAPHGQVTVGFSYIQGAAELKAALPEDLFREVLELHNQVIRDQLAEFGGYECRNGQGYFLFAFSTAARAVQFSLSAQEALMRVDWPADCLRLPECVKVVMNGLQLFNGPRLQIGMSTGQPGSIVPSELTGRADYFGNVANIAARVASVAAGGQTLLSSMAWDAARLELRKFGGGGVEAIDLGTYRLKGVDGAVQILQAHNQRIKMRPFRSIQDNVKVTKVSGPSLQAPKSRRGSVESEPSHLTVRVEHADSLMSRGSIDTKSASAGQEWGIPLMMGISEPVAAESMQDDGLARSPLAFNEPADGFALSGDVSFMGRLNVVVVLAPLKGKGRDEGGKMSEAAREALRGVPGSAVHHVIDVAAALERIVTNPGCILCLHESLMNAMDASVRGAANPALGRSGFRPLSTALDLLAAVREGVPWSSQPVLVTFGTQGKARQVEHRAERHLSAQELSKAGVETLLTDLREDFTQLHRFAAQYTKKRRVDRQHSARPVATSDAMWGGGQADDRRRSRAFPSSSRPSNRQSEESSLFVRPPKIDLDIAGAVASAASMGPSQLSPGDPASGRLSASGVMAVESSPANTRDSLRSLEHRGLEEMQDGSPGPSRHPSSTFPSPFSVAGSTRSVGFSSPFIKRRPWMTNASNMTRSITPQPTPGPLTPPAQPRTMPRDPIFAQPAPPVPDVISIRRQLLGLDPTQHRSQSANMMDILGMIEDAELGFGGKSSSKFAVLISAIFSVLQLVSDAVQVCNSDGRIEFANTAWENITGFKASEAMEESPIDLLALTESNIPDVVNELTDACAKGVKWTGRLLAARRNGSIFLTEIQVLPIKGPDGNVEYQIWMLKDLSIQVLSGDLMTS